MQHPLTTRLSPENDALLSRLTIRLRNAGTGKTIGSGVIYRSPSSDYVYIITAAHCLFEDTDSFTKPLELVLVDIYDDVNREYKSVEYRIKHELVNPSKKADVAVLVLEVQKVSDLVAEVPLVEAIATKQAYTDFAVKGFPQATKGEELACIYPTWIQEMPEINGFQVQLNEDYDDHAMNGYSGAGVFLLVGNKAYLTGILTRYRKEDKGRVIYSHKLNIVNDLLQRAGHSQIQMAFIGSHGLNKEFFESRVRASIKNLGKRYNPDVNFPVQIAARFDDITLNGRFKQRLIACFDWWLLPGRNMDRELETIKDAQDAYKEAKTFVKDWLSQLTWNASETIDLSPIRDRVNTLTLQLRSKEDEVYRLQREEDERTSKGKKETHRYAHEPEKYDPELNWFRQTLRSNRQFLDELDTHVNINLANHPRLIIDGEAGQGKSHLLGDTASERIKRGMPALLLLGQHFRSPKEPWESIVAELQLQCTKDEFLQALNDIGVQIGSRVLFMIDALNEGDGKSVWKDRLPGFIEEFRAYPHIGLVLSVRTSYWSDIVSEAIEKDTTVTHITHPGFQGNEYAALKFFCKEFDLSLPNFPVLAPEFSNPLFLYIICKSLSEAGQKAFPVGTQGISQTFSLLVNAVQQSLSQKHEEYKLKPSLTQQAIETFALEGFNRAKSRMIDLEENCRAIQKAFP